MEYQEKIFLDGEKMDVKENKVGVDQLIMKCSAFYMTK
jgi:hypothetical protein